MAYYVPFFSSTTLDYNYMNFIWNLMMTASQAANNFQVKGETTYNSSSNNSKKKKLKWIQMYNINNKNQQHVYVANVALNYFCIFFSYFFFCIFYVYFRSFTLTNVKQAHYMDFKYKIEIYSMRIYSVGQNYYSA